MPFNYNQNIAHLPDGLYKITEEYIDTIAQYCTEGFLKFNQVWANANLDQKMMVDFFRKEIVDHIESQKNVEKYLGRKTTLNAFKVYKNKILSSLLTYEIYQYKKHREHSQPSTIPLFIQLEKEGQALIKCINLDSFQRGKFVYASWATIHYDGKIPKHIKNQATVTTLGLVKESGIQGLIFRSSNYKIYKQIEPVGGKLLNEIPFSRDGKDFKLYFVQLALNSEQFTMAYNYLKKKEIQSSQQQVMPKL